MSEPDPPLSERNPAPHRPGQVLVTGAFGLVGSAVVRALTAEGYQVVATDLGLPANRLAATRLPKASARVQWADLTDAEQVDDLLRATSPTAIVHLAAIIPPACYRQRTLARAVNIDATRTLVRSAAALPNPPRFIQASSVAVYGPRNPHRIQGLLTADTPLRPTDLYGTHKAHAENLVRTSGLQWLILRLGGVLTVEPTFALNRDMLAFESALPADGRIQTVDVRDVATAMTAAVSAPATREVLLIGGDESHRLRHSDIGSALAAASGLRGGMPTGRPGDPDSDDDWFATDWMDTTRAQHLLGFQHHSLPAMLDEIRRRTGLLRLPMRIAAPLVRRYLTRLSPYRNTPGEFASPWRAIETHLGDPRPDRE